jgi:biopolymer transport protein TolR
MAFMIVAPSIKHGIDLQVPETRGEIIDKDETKTITVVIEPGEDGGEDRIYVEDTSLEEKARRVSLEELSRDLELKKMTFPQMDVFLEVDRQVSYDTFAKTLGTIKATGIENVGLVTDPIEPDKSAPR